ncbi:MAG: YceD family protein [Gemmatimonadaceae bacterium]
MLVFDKRAVEAKAAIVDDALAADDPVWQPSDPVPSDAVAVTGRLSAAGSGRFYWHGRISGSAVMPCRRCLADATVRVQDEAHVIFAEEGSDETDDPDVRVLDERSNQIDLRPTIREQWLLNVPSYAECREDCKGLCPTCGKDLNEGPCDCPAARDSRWDALRKIKTK